MQTHADAVRTAARNSQRVPSRVLTEQRRRCQQDELIFKTPPNVYVLFMKYSVWSALIRQARKRVCVYFLLLNTTAQIHRRVPDVRSAQPRQSLFTVAALLQIAGIVLSQILISQIQDEITSVSWAATEEEAPGSGTCSAAPSFSGADLECSEIPNGFVSLKM